MTKEELLEELVSEYQDKIRQPEDVTISDFRRVFLKKHGVRLGDKKIIGILSAEVEAGRMISLVVLDSGRNQDVRVWRRVKKKVSK